MVHGSETRIVIGTSNPTKAERLEQILGHEKSIRPETALEIPEGGDPHQNAQVKALSYAMEYQAPAIGWDDSIQYSSRSVDSPGAFIRRTTEGNELSRQEVFERTREAFVGLTPESRYGEITRALSLALPDGRTIVTVVPISFMIDPDQAFDPNLHNPLDAMIVPEGFGKPFSRFTEADKSRYEQLLAAGVQRLLAEHEALESGEATGRSITEGDVTYVFSDPEVRLFQEGDATSVAEMSGKIADFYDGHRAGWVVEKYGGDPNGDGTDPHGFFSKRKFLLVMGEESSPHAMLSIVFKRGGSMKTNTLRVADSHQGRGNGARIKREAIRMAQALRKRKVYCTTNAGNTAAYSLNMRLGYVIEGHLTAQYREGEIEVVLGQMLSPQEVDTVPLKPFMVLPEGKESGALGEAEVLDPATASLDVTSKVKAFVETHLSKWHDEVGDGSGFMENVFEGALRGVEDIDGKGKLIMYVLDEQSRVVGVGVLTLKMGQAAKLYPFIGSEAALRLIFDKMKEQAEALNSRKIYSFVPDLDMPGLQFLTNSEEDGGLGWYQEDGVLKAPYMPDRDLAIIGYHL